MIQPLRRWHFRIWIALACVLSALFAASLWLRPADAPANRGLTWELLP